MKALTTLRSSGAVLALLLSGTLLAADTVPTDIKQPGTQPQEVSNLESPDKCDNCHGGYNSSVEPAHNWRGSMMAHAGRDPIFWATVAIAEQDFLPGQGGAGDLCIRCHSTGGWLAGRSTPTDGSGLTAGDSDGVECDFCHKLTNPNNSEYQGVMNGEFQANDGLGEGYYGSGMASVWGGSEKLGPFTDAQARHQFLPSDFHRSADFCGTCHDVSNPAVGNLAHNHGAQATADSVVTDDTLGGDTLGGLVTGKAAFNNAPYKYGIVERTFSEYKSGLLSTTPVNEYPGLPADLRGGALQAIYVAATAARSDANYEDGDTRYYTCQSCHMRPVTGTGCNKKGVPVRTDLPLHDLTGGNYWMPEAIAYLDTAGKLRLGGAMTAQQTGAMLDGALRAREQLDLAATLSVTQGPTPTVKIVNHTGHKLISGYPEGRRMWLNVKWYDSVGTLLREDGAYGDLAVKIDGTDRVVRTLLDPDDPNTKVYQAHMGITQEWADQLVGLDPSYGSVPVSYNRVTGDSDYTLAQVAAQAPSTSHESFHFVLNNTVVSDDRIPPYGMSYDKARKRNALPVPADQYGNPGAGGTYNYWDEVTLNPPQNAGYAEIKLMYQPTSWEYIQFLHLANNGSDPALGGNAFLGEEGANMLDAWLNAGGADVRMAEPYAMASATWGSAPGVCTAPVPTLVSTVPADKAVSLTWSDESASGAITYSAYYDQAGKAQLIASALATTSYADTGLTNGQEYCYKVTSTDGTCESDFSNILCATPTQPGHTAYVDVTDPAPYTGRYVTSGNGKTAKTSFEPTSSFSAGDQVIVRLTVQDEANTPVANATVTVAITGPESATLTSAPSNASGLAEASWSTQSPNHKGNGGTAPGSYSATVTAVSASGYTWNGTPAAVSFTLQ